MAKKGIKYYIPGGIALVLGIAAFCMMFLPAINFTSGDLSSEGWTGAQLAFGYTEEILGEERNLLNFNIMMFLAFALPLIGGILAVLFQNGLLTKIVTTACFVVGAVFLFSTVGLSSIGYVSLESDSLIGQGINAVFEMIYEAIDETKTLAVGPIIGAVLAILGAVVCFFKGSIAKALGGN